MAKSDGIKMPNIELHIEELMLHGFTPGDRYRIGDVVQRELARLFSEPAVHSSLSHSGAIDRLDAGPFHVASGSRAAVVGTQIAQALYGALNR